jgi:cyclase
MYGAGRTSRRIERRAAGIGILMAAMVFAMAPPKARTEGRQTDEAALAANNFEVKKLAEGVFAVMRLDPPGLMVDANDVFIIGDDGVIVVDTNGSPATTRKVLQALRKLTDKPVKYVVNTHGHDDHIRGNRVYQEAFPGVQFIGHTRTREALLAKGELNRKQFLEGAPGVTKKLRDALKNNKSIAGWDLTGEERESYISDIRLAELAVNDAASAPMILPTITIEDRLTLHQAGRTVDIRYIGRGHTSGDLVIHLPQDGILITGDLVVWPVPFIGSDQSHIGEWSTTLDTLRALQPRIIVPGHGPLQSHDSYLKVLSEMFASISQQTRAAVLRGDTLDEARKSVSLDEFRLRIAADSKLRRVIFANYVSYPAIAAAYADAKARK